MSSNAKSAKREQGKTTAVRRNWTVMVYLGGDNNLSEQMVTTLKGMRNAGLHNHDQIYIAACFDSVYPTVKTSYYFFDGNTGSGGKEKKDVFDFRIANGSVAKDNGDEASTATQLSDFVKWCAENCPANNYCLILSGHGDAFRGKTLMYDESPSSSLTVDALRIALEKARRHLPGRNGRRRFAVLGFDNCAMSTIEIAFELRDIADYMVASEGWVPQSGWEYEGPLNSMIDDPKLSAKQVADNFVTDFIDFEYDYTIGGRSVDLSVCNLKNLENDNNLNVVTRLNQLGKVLGDIFKNVPPAPDEIVVQDVFKKLITNAHWNAQTFFYEQTVDIYDFCSLLGEECKSLAALIGVAGVNGKPKSPTKKTNGPTDVGEQLRRVASACENVLSTKDFFVDNKIAGPAFRFSEGIAVFLPWTRISFLSCRQTYKRTRLFKDQGFNGRAWFDFIDQFTKATMRVKNGTVAKKGDFEYAFTGTGGAQLNSSTVKTGGIYRNELDILKDSFASYKNYDIRWQVKE